ncbi:MAG: GNAT family N-acetyltransferase [Sulfobacillus sp.]
MNVELLTVTENDRATVQHLYQFYHYDFTEYTGESLGPGGRYAADVSYLWNDKRWNPFLIKSSGEWAGFAVVLFENMETDPDPTHVIWDFFILRKFRRTGLGSGVAKRIFSMYNADWKVAELKTNVPAREFWRKVISEFTNGQFSELYREDTGKWFQSFTTKNHLAQKH